MKFKKLLIFGIALILILAYIFLFNMTPMDYQNPNLKPFSEEGFVDSMDLSNQNRLVAENDHFLLHIDETTSYIRVTDKRNGEVWRSNPVDQDPWDLNPNKTITATAKARQKSTLEIVYFNRAGSLTTRNNYDYSIYHPESVLAPAGLRTFSIKYLENAVQVLYEISDLEIDYLYFPKYLPKDVLENMPERSTLEFIYARFDRDLDAYEITIYKEMSLNIKKILYDIFYVNGDYTRERAINENYEYGYTEQFEKPTFEIAIEIKLHPDGIETSILANSIKEPSDVKLARITLYPLFGTAVSVIGNQPTEGYIVLPDGSGAVIDFNNGKQHVSPFRKRVYGDDISMLSYKMPEQQQKMNIPLYGMIKENHGFAAIITEGDGMAAIHADVSERIDSYNKANVSFNLRESESVILGSGFNRYGIDIWTRERVNTDFSVRYIFLDEDDASYVGIAKAYQNYLITEKGFKQNDVSNVTMLTAEFIGAYDEKAFFLGVPYKTMGSMTSFKEAQMIIETLRLRNVEHMNVLYTGMFNGGLSSDLQDRAHIEKVIGGEKAFNQFIEELSAMNIAVYPNLNVMTAASYHRLFDQYRYTASRIKGSHAKDFTYHYPSYLPYSETPFSQRGDDYVINPMYYLELMERLEKNTSFDRVAFSMLGSRLAGHYPRSSIIFRQDAMNIQQQLFNQLDYDLMLNNPLAFAMPYASYMIDLPTETTLYAIIDDQIPLLQLVLSGLVNYTAESLNLSQDRSPQYKFLKTLETGSHLKYTLSYHSSSRLLNTDYNYYMSTHYVNWTDQIVNQINEMNTLGIHQGHLVNHERLLKNVYRVTYSHGLSLVLNYNLNLVTIDGVDISAMSYVVWEA
jgi:hypothetical protein